MKKVLFGFILIVFLFLLYLLFVTFTNTASQIEVDPIEPIKVSDSTILVLKEAVQIRTITNDSEKSIDTSEFQKFNNLLSKRYDAVYRSLEHRIFNDFSHLFYWQGTDSSLRPIVLMAHLDVVPIAAPEQWEEDPFGGAIKEGILWGRGTMDDKFSLITLLEAVEMLLEEGYQPKRSIFLSFGHDEEIGGSKGAVAIADYLKNKGIKASFVLDEGMAILQDMIPGIEKEIAFIGTAEKGIVSLELDVHMEGGHSSQPARETPIDILSQAILNIKSHPLPARISESMDGFMAKLGPEMPFTTRLIMANRGLLGPLITNSYSSMSNAGNALVRTTTAPTVFHSGVKENVLPASARAIVNFRIIPGQTADEVFAHVKDVVADDRVEIRFFGPKTDPSPVSPTHSYGYKLLEQTIKEVFPHVLIAPNLVVGATDSRHFTEISDNIYRFVPFKIHPGNISSFHGVNERISIDECNNAVRFYYRLISQNGLSFPSPG